MVAAQHYQYGKGNEKLYRCNEPETVPNLRPVSSQNQRQQSCKSGNQSGLPQVIEECCPVLEQLARQRGGSHEN